VRQIQDKFPEKSSGLKELYEKGPQAGFAIKNPPKKTLPKKPKKPHKKPTKNSFLGFFKFFFFYQNNTNFSH
jgi:hypothetical protein